MIYVHAFILSALYSLAVDILLDACYLVATSDLVRCWQWLGAFQ
jgi:hypothetical protein